MDTNTRGFVTTTLSPFMWRRVPGVPQYEDTTLGLSAISRAESRLLSKRLELSWLKSEGSATPEQVRACEKELEIFLEAVKEMRVPGPGTGTETGTDTVPVSVPVPVPVSVPLAECMSVSACTRSIHAVHCKDTK